MKYIKLISLWAMAMVAVPAFAATVGEGSTITAPGADGKPVVVAAGQKVPENATISTEEGKEASIVLENGSVVVVSAGAIVKVNGNNVEVIGGNVVVDVVATVVVRTPQGSVSCSEGTVGISASPAETKVTSVKGTWRAESSSGSVKALGQGQTIVLKADGSSQVRNATPSEVAGVSAVQNTAVPAAKGETPAPAAAAAPAEPSTTPEIPGSDSSADTPISGSDA